MFLDYGSSYFHLKHQLLLLFLKLIKNIMFFLFEPRSARWVLKVQVNNNNIK